MNPPEPNDPLDALLREENRYIDDNGFTSRVVSALPKPRRRARPRVMLLLGATCVGSVLAIFWLPWENLASTLSSSTPNPQLLLNAFVLLCIAGSLVWSVVAALASEE
jgi:hypothetical protein